MFLRSIQKIFAQLIGLILIVFGSVLFLKGITGEFTFLVEYKGIKGTLIGASPGLLFIVLGCIIVVAVVRAKEEHTESITTKIKPDGEQESTTSRSSAGCFITTAVCDGLFKDDDCEELNIFREFRDKCLLNDPVGIALAEEYYRVSPSLAAEIHKSDEKRELCILLYNTFITPFIEAYNNGNIQLATTIGLHMIATLQESTQEHKDSLLEVRDIKKILSKNGIRYTSKK